MMRRFILAVLTVMVVGCGAAADKANSATSTGAMGTQGEVGPAGPQGPQGIQGVAGQVGPQGPRGSAGAAGPQGLQGVTGSTGLPGTAGATGPQGPVGTSGSSGPQGPQGPAGAKGDAGSMGPHVAVYANDGRRLGLLAPGYLPGGTNQIPTLAFVTRQSDYLGVQDGWYVNGVPTGILFLGAGCTGQAYIATGAGVGPVVMNQLFWTPNGVWTASGSADPGAPVVNSPATHGYASAWMGGACANQGGSTMALPLYTYLGGNQLATSFPWTVRVE